MIGNTGNLISFMSGGAKSEAPRQGAAILIGPDIIFFGSSYTWAGINVDVIEEETEMSAIKVPLLGATFDFVRDSFYRGLSRRREIKIAVVEIITSEQFEMKRKALSVSAEEMDELLAMEAWGESLGVKTFFYFPPSGRSPDHIERIEVQDFDDPLIYPELFNPAVRQDEAHLNGKGAKIFSILISHEIMSCITL